MNNRRPLVIAIAAVSGGGKTAITTQLNKLLPNSKALFFDDYEIDGPDDICDWVERGADYDEWKLTPLIDDLCSLSDDSSPSFDYILLDYPFAYLHSKMREYIDFTIFIDTPLDIAMARRVLRDFNKVPLEHLKNGLEIYLFRGRVAYLEALNTIKPNCDLIIDGSLPVDIILNQIYKKIEEISKRK